MMDTFVITISAGNYEVTDPNRFRPSAEDLLTLFPRTGHVIKYIQNPTRKQLRERGYKGNLTLMRYRTRGGLRTDLVYQASAPKVLFQNNLAEVSEDQFGALCAAIVALLATQGIATSCDAVAGALASRVDYGKNVLLPLGTTAFRAIEELYRAGSSERWRTERTDHQNGGYGVAHSTLDRRLEVYDKRAELSGAGPYRIDRSQGRYQGGLAPIDSAFPEVVRMEYQMNDPREITKMAAAIGAPPDRTLAALFKDDIARRLIGTLFDEWLASVPAPLSSQSVTEIADDLRATNPKLTGTEAITQAGFILLEREKGVKGARRWMRGTRMTTKQVAYRETTLLPHACSGAGEKVLRAMRDQIHAWELITPESHPELFSSYPAMALVGHWGFAGE